MSKTRQHILAQITTCESCGEYNHHCTCNSDIVMCRSCGEHAIDCRCDSDLTPLVLDIQHLRPAIN